MICSLENLKNTKIKHIIDIMIFRQCLFKLLPTDQRRPPRTSHDTSTCHVYVCHAAHNVTLHCMDSCRM